MTGADFFPSLIRQLVARDRRVFFLGGKPGVAQRTADALATQVPGFQPVGIAHGYFDEADSPRLVAQIQAANTDLLVVGLGSPRQERWISSNLKTMSIPLTWAVGALFDYAAGEERRCPRWMGEHGLEWLFRLAVNPRRMAKRYLWGNPQFVASILGAKRSRLRSRAKSADRLSCRPSDSTVE
jgi:exopolysaccharide biosynthesis WecB/TagA/CpsF family protein